MATKIDVLFAAKAFSKEVNKRVKSLEDEVKAEFLEDYRRDGTDRRRSPLFGGDAGCLTMKGGKDSEHVVSFQLADYDAAIDWMDEERPETDGFATANLERFCEWWFHSTGELPAGCEVMEYDTEPGDPTPVLTVKESVVLPLLRDNAALSGEVNQLLLSDGE